MCMQTMYQTPFTADDLTSFLLTLSFTGPRTHTHMHDFEKIGG